MHAGTRTAYSDVAAIGLVVITYIRGCLLNLIMPTYS